MRLYLKSIEKCGALSILAQEVNISIELVDYQLTNNQAQAYAIGINLPLFFFDASKKFKQFILVLFLDAYAIVYHRQSDKIFGTLLNNDGDFSISICKFYGVWQEI